jgi:hypothetical protein
VLTLKAALSTGPGFKLLAPIFEMGPKAVGAPTALLVFGIVLDCPQLLVIVAKTFTDPLPPIDVNVA